LDGITLMSIFAGQSLNFKTMKRIYLFVVLLVLVSCTKEELIPDEKNTYLESINDLRINSTPSVGLLKWDNELLTVCEKSTNYFNKNGEFPNVTTVINEMGGIHSGVCLIGVDVLNHKNFDLVTYLKTTAATFTYNPKYTKFALYVKDNGISICFGY